MGPTRVRQCRSRFADKQQGTIHVGSGIAPETLAELAKRLRGEVTAIARGIVQAAEENHSPHSPLGCGDLPLDDTRMDADEEYMLATGRL